MKTIIAVIITVAVMVPTSAFASAQWTHNSNGVMCKSTADGIIGCIPSNGRGYGVGISRDMVAIYDVSREKMVAIRRQP